MLIGMTITGQKISEVYDYGQKLWPCGCPISALLAATKITMKLRQAAVCRRCGLAGRHRWIDDLLRFQLNKIGVILCDTCYKSLIQADAEAWRWFRKFRDSSD
jgi:hypothetical protein